MPPVPEEWLRSDPERYRLTYGRLPLRRLHPRRPAKVCSAHVSTLRATLAAVACTATINLPVGALAGVGLAETILFVWLACCASESERQR